VRECFSRAGDCNKLKPVSFSCTFYRVLRTEKTTKWHRRGSALTKGAEKEGEDASVENVTKEGTNGRPAVLQIE